MSAIDGFAHAAKRLMGGAMNGAIGGAVCGAALGIIAEMVKGNSTAANVDLPIQAPFLIKNAELLQRVAEIISVLPAKFAPYSVDLVRNVDILCRIDQQGNIGRATPALATRSLRVVQRIIKISLSIAPGAGLRETMEELVQSCDDIVHNACMGD